jgi:hypothetical protein
LLQVNNLDGVATLTRLADLMVAASESCSPYSIYVIKRRVTFFGSCAIYVGHVPQGDAGATEHLLRIEADA